ncbi:MAG: Dam family site-specific DNA-(adenine-N6)-methyltransferase [Dehalococcoidia bacterium]|nr:Dam family site-specific DNA-(adenine-N6)-methyltransferase [Dehalococcoidia bacterium]
MVLTSLPMAPIPTQPIIKWAGGKTQLLGKILSAIPQHFETYHEPFFGGGAVFFALAAAGRVPRAVLSDMNPDLVNLYRVVRNDADALIAELQDLELRYLSADEHQRSSFYYCIRGQAPEDSLRSAARTIFLNKTCYNGLYRVNRQGRFNVPHGRYANPKICNQPVILAASEALKLAEIKGPEDFSTVVTRARGGDLVYFDPPYHPLSATASFTAYTADDFAWGDQLRLRQTFDELVTQGVTVLLSDSAHPNVIDLYEPKYVVNRVSARRAINSNGQLRGPVTEILVQGRQPPSTQPEVEPQPVLQVV